MPIVSLANRAHRLERIDAAAHDPDELRRSLTEMARVNRWLGGNRVVKRHLEKHIQSPNCGKMVRVLDVGTGRGDMPHHITRWLGGSEALRVCAADLQPQIARVAREANDTNPSVAVLAADGLHLPFADDSFDVALSSLTLHHFSDAVAAAFVAEMARVARRGVIVNDLERHPVNYAGARVLAATVWRRDEYSRIDGPLSVLRAFTREELLQVGIDAGLKEFDVFRHFPYRLALVGRAKGASA